MLSKNFDLSKKYLKRIIGFLAALIIFQGISSALNYMYVRENEWAHFLWHHFYEDKGKIDNICIGSSHVFTDINPAMLDEINGQYNFNLSTSGLRLNGSYYLLKEAAHNNSLSHVYIELYYAVNSKKTFNSNSDPIYSEYYWNWTNTDNMKFSINKLEYMFSIAGPDKYINILLPFTRYQSKLGRSDYIETQIAAKQEEDYLAYKYYSDNADGSYTEYFKQGYSCTNRMVKSKKRLLEQSRLLEENPMGETSEKYLRKIISYCQKKELPLTLFVSPIDELQLISIGNYDNYVNQVKGIAEEYNVEFYDFNLAKEEFLSIQQSEYFRDDGHLNDTGAAIFTSLFGEVMSGNAAENEKFFYNSYAEKLQAQTPDVYGLYYRDSKTAQEGGLESSRTIWVASNRDEGMEYQITLSPEDGEKYIVQDFMPNKEFTISSNEHGICTITARMKDGSAEVQSYEIKY